MVMLFLEKQAGTSASRISALVAPAGRMCRDLCPACLPTVLVVLSALII